MKHTVHLRILMILAVLFCSFGATHQCQGASSSTKARLDSARRNFITLNKRATPRGHLHDPVWLTSLYASEISFPASRQPIAEDLFQAYVNDCRPLADAVDKARADYYNATLYRADCSDQQIRKVVAALLESETTYDQRKWAVIRDLRKLLTPQQAVAWDDAHGHGRMAASYLERKLPIANVPNLDDASAADLKITDQQRQAIKQTRERWDQKGWERLRFLDKKLVETLQDPEWKDEDFARMIDDGLSHLIPMCSERMAHEKRILQVLTAEQREKFWLSKIEAK